MATKAARMIRHAPRTEHGFTLTELLVAVTITGIIVAAIATVLMQGLTLAPETAERTNRAAREARLVDLMSDDIANATNAVPTTPNTVFTNDCEALFAPVDGVVDDIIALVGWVTISLVGGGSVGYMGFLQEYSPTHHKVSIYRGASVVFEGYCGIGAEDVIALTYAPPKITYVVQLSRTAEDAPETFFVEGDQRTIG